MSRKALGLCLSFNGEAPALIEIGVGLYSPARAMFRSVSAMIDSGANITAIPMHIARDWGITVSEESDHVWQAVHPLTLKRASVTLRYAASSYELACLVLEIPENYLRSALPEEICTVLRILTHSQNASFWGRIFFGDCRKTSAKRFSHSFQTLARLEATRGVRHACDSRV